MKHAFPDDGSTSFYRKKDNGCETDPSTVVIQFDETFQNARVTKADEYYPDNSTSTKRVSQEVQSMENLLEYIKENNLSESELRRVEGDEEIFKTFVEFRFTYTYFPFHFYCH